MGADLIAITGVAARCAGADNVNEYWRLLSAARPQFRAVPDDRWARRETDRFPGRDNLSYSHTMAPVTDPFELDAGRFHIPKARAKRMDPQQRMAINLVDELLGRNSDGGQPLKDRRIATIIGVSSTDYRSISTAPVVSDLLVDGTLGTGNPTERRIVRNVANAAVQPMSGHTMPGVLANMVPAAVQSTFNLNGPAFSVDSVCASSLTAIEMACAMLQLKRTRACIAGGVYTALTPEAHVGFSAIGALSRTGECRPFTSAANGFVIGEGGAMVLLKCLDDALEDGDDILGIICALGSSNDGRAEGVMTPTVSGQINAIEEAARVSGGVSLEVDAIEGHGTGTVVGDRTELETIRQIYADRASRVPIYLGSAKAVIGHTMAASGALGVVKAVLSLIHNCWPAQPVEDQILPHSLLKATGFKLTESAFDKPTRIRRVAVNSFGFGGTNSHIVIESPEEVATHA